MRAAKTGGSSGESGRRIWGLVSPQEEPELCAGRLVTEIDAIAERVFFAGRMEEGGDEEGWNKCGDSWNYGSEESDAR